MRSSFATRINFLADAARHDIAFAIRGLRRSPGLSASIIMTLAFGIGANSAMFTVVDRVFFLAPPGVVNPTLVHRLVAHKLSYEKTEIPSEVFSTRLHQAFGAAVAGLGEVEGYEPESDVHVDGGGETHTVGYATTGFLHLAGVRPARGRFFDDTENRYGAPVHVAVLNYSYWTRAFGADPRALGRKIQLDSIQFTIIGVAQRGWDGMDLDAVDVWVPLASKPSGMEGPWWEGEFGVLHLFARARTAGTEFRLRAALKGLYRADREARGGAAVDGELPYLELEPLAQGRTSAGLGYQDQRNVALMLRLVGVSLFVLIIGICNSASLLLMRALRRRREIAVRISLGASRARLALHFAIESLLLAGVAGVAAVWLAYVTGSTLRSQLIGDIHWSATLIGSRVVALTVMLAIVAGTLAGLAPLAVVRRGDLTTALKAGAAESGRPRSAIRVGLLATQTGLCMVMLSAAGMFLQTLRHANTFDLGFDADRLVTFRLPISEPLMPAIIARIRALPEVAAVSRSQADVRGAGVADLQLSSASGVAPGGPVSFVHIDTNFTRTNGIRIVHGRDALATLDGTDSVALVNETMARRFWPGLDPVGQRFAPAYAKWSWRYRIAGVFRDVRWDLTHPSPAQYYAVTSLPTRLQWSMAAVTVRTRQRATARTVASINEILRPVAAQAFVPPIPRLVSDRLEPQLHPWRVAAVMFLAFGLLGLIAATAGIYGLVGYEVTQRTHEFGVRITLGATARSILTLVLTSGARVVVVGLAAGLISSLLLGRAIASLVFQMSPYDPVVLSMTLVTLAVTAVLASIIPAWRATRVDPVNALRAE